MFFDELVEQHRVHRLVAHRVRLALVVPRDQIGVHLFYILGHEAELRDAFRIHVRSVLEGHRAECQQYVACLAHRLNVLLETLRGRCHAKLTAAIYNNGRARNGRPADAGDKGSRLGSYPADANCIGFTSNTSVAYLDIVTSDGQVEACIIAQRDVERTGCVLTECVLPVSRIVDAGCVEIERTLTGGGTIVAGCVKCKRTGAGGRILVARCVAQERLITVGRIGAARCVEYESTCTASGVVATGCVECKRTGTGGRVVAADVVV